jgi:hypothetical protein
MNRKTPAMHTALPLQNIKTVESTTVGALIMLGTLFGLIILIFALVLRYDPQARGPSKNKGD